MAKLSAFRVDADAIKEGEWVPVGAEFDNLEIRTRGLTDEYYDVQARRQLRAAKGLGGDVSRIPNAVRRSINTEILIEFVLLDVRNLQHDDGRDVTIDEFREMIRQPHYAELLLACYRAANQVGQRRGAELEDALGN